MNESRRNGSARIQVPEICQRLALGRQAVYGLLEAGIIPAIRLRRKWLISRQSYLDWEKSFGQTRTLNNSFAVQ